MFLSNTLQIALIRRGNRFSSLFQFEKFVQYNQEMPCGLGKDLSFNQALG